MPNSKDSTHHLIDSSCKLFIGSIEIEGNNKTRDYLILREMTIKKGDSVVAGEIFEQLQRSKELVYNTQLFITVDIKPALEEPDNVKLKVVVRERWYIFPIPQFQMVDRNFNEWYYTFNADPERVIYGLKFLHYNFSGRKDELKLYVLDGYSRNLSVNYTAPYSNPALTEGFSIGAGYTQNREISYKTSLENKLLQFNNGGFVRNSLLLNMAYQRRKGYYHKQVLQVSYIHQKVTDSISQKYNPNYFSNNKSVAGYPDISYTMSYINTDNIAFPLKGKIYFISLIKRGLHWRGNNSFFDIDASYSSFIGHKRNFFSSIQLFGRIKLPFEQPYINQKALGYGELYLRGLEYYVVDGVAATLGKYTLKKKLWSFKLPVPLKIKSLPYLPFTFFAKTFADLGYCYNKSEMSYRLNNKLLYSGGFGIDILMLYDLSVRIEYSFNQLGEKGLFLHSKGGF